MSPFRLIAASWVIFVLVWGISALNVKRDIRSGWGPVWARFWIVRVVVIGLVVALLSRLWVRVGAPGARFTGGLFATSSPLLAWLGAAMSVIGLAFAIWARWHIGRNWSGSPAIKQDHELVTTGPYTFVRHPIYSGMLFAMAGVALAGIPLGPIWFLAFLLVFIARIPKEERYMLELFPHAYPDYRARTKRLIPFVW